MQPGLWGIATVTEATGGMIRLRALVGSAAAPSLWDLRCLVREHLVGWVRDLRPTALPRLRTEVADGGHPAIVDGPRVPDRRTPDAPGARRTG